PIEADVFLRASSGGRTSVERRVTVALPAFVADLELTARYPAYLARPDEPLVAGPDTILVPEGTVIVTNGAASVPLATAAGRGSWTRPGAACCRATRCGSAWRRGITPRCRIRVGARRSPCGCRASRSCGRRCAPRRAAWSRPRIRSPAPSATWASVPAIWRNSARATRRQEAGG